MRLIFTADWHLRDTLPSCRPDLPLFLAEQWDRVDSILNEHGTVIVAGDLFHVNRPSLSLISTVISALLARKVVGSRYMIAGNHDLVGHSLLNLAKSGFGVVDAACNLLPTPSSPVCQGSVAVWFCSYGQTIPSQAQVKQNGWMTNILIMHKLTVPSTGSFIPGIESAVDVLQQYPYFTGIVCGDNHGPFLETFRGRWFLSPGAITKQTIDQQDVSLGYWIYEDRLPVWVPFPNQSEQFLNSSIQIPQDEKLAEMVNRLSEHFTVNVSFRSNLETFFRLTRVQSGVKEAVWDIVDAVNRV